MGDSVVQVCPRSPSITVTGFQRNAIRRPSRHPYSSTRLQEYRPPRIAIANTLYALHETSAGEPSCAGQNLSNGCHQYQRLIQFRMDAPVYRTDSAPLVELLDFHPKDGNRGNYPLFRWVRHRQWALRRLVGFDSARACTRARFRTRQSGVQRCLSARQSSGPLELMIFSS